MVAAWQLSVSDVAIIAIVVVVISFLLYRLFRGEPSLRIARLGVFIERVKSSEPQEEPPPDDGHDE